LYSASISKTPEALNRHCLDVLRAVLNRDVISVIISSHVLPQSLTRTVHATTETDKTFSRRSSSYGNMTDRQQLLVLQSFRRLVGQLRWLTREDGPWSGMDRQTDRQTVSAGRRIISDGERRATTAAARRYNHIHVQHGVDTCVFDDFWPSLESERATPDSWVLRPCGQTWPAQIWQPDNVKRNLSGCSGHFLRHCVPTLTPVEGHACVAEQWTVTKKVSKNHGLCFAFVNQALWVGWMQRRSWQTTLLRLPATESKNTRLVWVDRVSSVLSVQSYTGTYTVIKANKNSVCTSCSTVSYFDPQEILWK